MYITYVYIGVIRTISATAGDENLGIFHTFFPARKNNWPGRFSPMSRYRLRKADRDSHRYHVEKRVVYYDKTHSPKKTMIT